MSLVTIGASAADDGFKDADKINNTEAVEVLSAMGVIGGYGDGTFRPQSTLTRGAGAKFIAYLMLGQEKADKLAATYTVFSDVDDSVGLAAYIEWAAANNIVGGYGDGRFGPYDTLTQYAFGKMLLAALGYDAAKEGFTGAGWQKNVYKLAVATEIYDGTETYGACDRETAARFALGALLAQEVEYGKKYEGTKDGDDFSLSSKEGRLYGAELWVGYEDLEYYGGYEYATLEVGELKGTKALKDFAAPEQDVYGRPGHAWTYGDDFEKFYMDEPVAEYTEAVSRCDVLVDIGIAKTSKKSADVIYYQNGLLMTDWCDSYKHTHSSADGIVCNDTLGGQGTLTQVFKVGDVYYVTEINTMLAEVQSAKDNTHLTKGTSVLDVYYTGRLLNQGDTKAKAAGAKETVTVDGNVGYEKYDLVLVNVGFGQSLIYDEYDDNGSVKEGAEHIAWMYEDQYEGKYNSTVAFALSVIGEPTVIENAKYTGVKNDKSEAKVAGSWEKVAAQYSASVSGLSDSSTVFGTKFDFYVDQYGNLIGDANPESIYTYGVIDTAQWVDERIGTDDHADVWFVDGTATGSLITVEKYNNLNTAKVTDDNGAASATGGTAFFNSDKNRNNYYTETTDKGVVKYLGDGKFVTVTSPDTIVSKTGAKVVKGETELFDENGAKFAYVNNSTVFLVRTKNSDGDFVYNSYVGKNNVPSISNAKSITAVTEEDATCAVFVFVDATTGTFDGQSATVYFVADKAAKGNDDGKILFKAYLDGELKDFTAVSASVYAQINENGLWKLSFNADGEVIGATDVDDLNGNATYKSYHAEDVVTDDGNKTLVAYAYGHNDADEYAYSWAVDNAKFYTITYKTTALYGYEVSVSVGGLDEIDNNAVVVVKQNADDSYIADVVYVFVSEN